MRILVTGGGGFIGSHIAGHLVARGHDVTVADNLSTGRREQVPAETAFHGVSVLDPEFVPLCRDMDAVVHTAAQISVASSWQDPVADAVANIIGTIRTLQAALAGGVRRFAYLSSAAVYASEGGRAIAEEHPLAPLSPYGISKLTGERYVRRLCERDGADWLIFRLANVYGPRQNAEGEAGVVARWTAAMAAGQAVILQGDGGQTRDFIYVGDVAEAVALGLEQPGCARTVFNVGTGRATSLRELLTCLEAAAGVRAKVVSAPPRPGDIRHSRLDVTKARQVLGWEASTPLEDGLRATVAWQARPTA